MLFRSMNGSPLSLLLGTSIVAFLGLELVEGTEGMVKKDVSEEAGRRNDILQQGFLKTQNTRRSHHFYGRNKKIAPSY